MRSRKLKLDFAAISDQLYGRDKELFLLKEVYNDDETQAVLVKGICGSGKNKLVVIWLLSFVLLVLLLAVVLKVGRKQSQ
jgi:hypothetical protein